MKQKRPKLSEQIRRAVDACPMSRYAICCEAFVDQAAMSRFMAGKVGLSMASLDALAGVLGLEVVARGPLRLLAPQKRGPKPKKGARP